MRRLLKDVVVLSMGATGALLFAVAVVLLTAAHDLDDGDSGPENEDQNNPPRP